MVAQRFEIWLVALDPTQGSEIAKTRPCVIISPNSVNKMLNTVIVAPLTSTQKSYPTRINCQFANQMGQVALDQLRSIDKLRLVKRLGVFDELTNHRICQTLRALFTF